MSFTTLTHWSEVASMLLAVLLSIALIALCLRAYVRSRKALFLLLFPVLSKTRIHLSDRRFNLLNNILPIRMFDRNAESQGQRA